MVERRNGKLPLYEIVGSRDHAAPARGAEGPSASPADHHTKVFVTSPRSPTLLRIPRGLAVLIILGFAALIVLAYWVGLTRGRQGQALSGVPAIPGLPEHAPAGVSSEPVSPGVTPPSPGDRRRQGLNYIEIALYEEAQARRLAGFLAQNGVEVALILYDNKRLGPDRKLYRVIDLRGFESGQLQSQEYRDHLKRLRQLGQVWKSQHNGPDDLKDMWPNKYGG